MKFNFDIPEESQEIFSEDANYFVENLHKKFDTKINALLEERKKRQKSFDEGSLPDFLDDTKEIRESEWQVRPIPKDLLDRRV